MIAVGHRIVVRDRGEQDVFSGRVGQVVRVVPVPGRGRTDALVELDGVGGQHWRDVADLDPAPAAERLVIAGGPRTGKTTLAASCAEYAGVDPRCTDPLMDLGWSEASAAVATWFDAEGPWIVEGVSTVRALRKWLAAHPEGKPCDRVILLREVVVDPAELKPGHRSMAKGVETVWSEIVGELRARGVEIEMPAKAGAA